MIDEGVAGTGDANWGVNLVPHSTALAIAYLLALPIAWDREQEKRSAVLRTFPLVAIASCGFLQRRKRLSKATRKPLRVSLKASLPEWASTAAVQF